MKQEKTEYYQDLRDRYLATQGCLAHLATKDSRRRHAHEIDIQSIGNPFIRDQSVLLSSKASRRMGGKNQVASSALMPHVRNRATHTNEVNAHSIRLADHLGLNAHLSGAIAFGHDIGHVPYGHQGEEFIAKKLGVDFIHERFGVTVAQHIERKGVGLNLTHATLDGMFRHSGQNVSADMTQEAWVVRYADKIAYLFADYNDFARFQWDCGEELAAVMDWFGDSQRNRTFTTMVHLAEESAKTGKVSFQHSEAAQKFEKLRKLMYGEYSKVVEQDVADRLDSIYDFLDKSGRIPGWLGVALLTDAEVCSLVGTPNLVMWKSINDTGLGEIINLVPKKKLFGIDPLVLDLDW